MSPGRNASDTIRTEAVYELVRKIAQGGMGSVYEVTQHGTNGFIKRMAVKTVLSRYTSNIEFVDMFIGEARLVSDLVHQNIVQIYQLGKDQAGYFIAMEFIDGVDLEDLMVRHKVLEAPLPVETAAFIVSRVCRALQYAHQKKDVDGQPLGIVHRDVSPRNIMVTHDGVVKLTDFGVAKAVRYMQHVREGEVLMGKAEYMSPEQAAYENTDARSDIFSLGIVFYEMLTGVQLFAASDVFQSLENCQFKPVDLVSRHRPDVPEDLETIVMKALERDLDKRYQTAGDMGHDLEYYMYHDHYGMTNEKLADYLRELYPPPPPEAAPPRVDGPEPAADDAQGRGQRESFDF